MKQLPEEIIFVKNNPFHFKSEEARLDAVRVQLDILTTTDSHADRNQAALVLADLKPMGRIDEEAVEIILQMIFDPKTENARGTLIYALSKMKGLKLKSSVLVRMLIENTGEAFEEAISLLYEGRFIPEGVQDQLRQLEQALCNVHDIRYEDLNEVHGMLTQFASKPVQLSFNAIFANIPWSIAMLNIRVEELARNHGFDCHEWEEDGLGPARGFAAMLPSGLWVGFREQDHLIEMEKAKGPTIEVDSPIVANSDELLNEVLSAFGLTDAAIDTKRIANTDNWT